MKMFKIMLSCFMSLMFIFLTVLPASALLKESSSQFNIINDCHIPEIVQDNAEANANHLYRIREQEDLSSVLFQNNDGTKTLYIFSENVKYIDDNGTTRDKSNAIYSSSNKNYAFENRENDIKTYFPKQIADGVTVSYNEYKLTLSPIVSSKAISTAQKITTSLISDNKAAERIRYSNVYNEDTSIVYTPLYSGVKEDIILNRYTNASTFSFSLKTHGLSLASTAGGLCLMSLSSKDPIAYIGEIIVYDSVGNISQGNIAFTTVKAYQEYTLTISVSNDFLTSKNTVYPVSIDPSITFNTSGSGTSKTIQDSPLYSGYPNTPSGSNGYNLVGYINSSYKIGRTLYQFPAFKNNNTYSKLAAAEIANVTLHVREASGKASPMALIHSYIYEGDAWNESTVTYNSASFSNNYDNETPLDSAYFNNGSGAWAQFDITAAARKWKNGTENNGIVLKNNNETDSGHYRNFLSTEYGSYKPYITVLYSEQFYSAGYMHEMGNYKNQLYYGQYLYDDKLQLRANCYGYAMRLYYSGQYLPAVIGSSENGTFYPAYRAYKQQPGEFIDKRHGYQIEKYYNYEINNYEDLKGFYNSYFSNTQLTKRQRVEIIYELVCKDMEQLGFTCEHLANVSTNEDFVIPQEQNGKRLIALVATSNDYHFYMQSSTDKWTHKPGEAPATDLCLDCEVCQCGNNGSEDCDCETKQGVKLTNSNFLEHACEGYYEGSDICFFYINKPPIMDYGHEDGHTNNPTQTTPDFADVAGNLFDNARHIGYAKVNNMIPGRIDYNDDIDYLKFVAPETGVYTIFLNNDLKLNATFYSSDVNPIATKNNQNYISFTQSLIGGETYWLQISDPEMTVFTADWEYVISFSVPQ